jgi:hypothetical protein
MSASRNPETSVTARSVFSPRHGRRRNRREQVGRASVTYSWELVEKR